MSRQRIIITSSIFVSLALGLLLFINLSDNRIAYAAANGDYRTATSGNWSSTATWEKYNGSIWVAASSSPTSTNGVITIQNGHTVIVTSNIIVDEVVVNSGGQITLNSGATLNISDGTGTDLDISGILNNAGTITINSGAAITFQSGGTYQHNYTTTAGTIPTATWNTGSTCEVIGFTSNTSAPGGLQSFYNFTWNCPSQSGTVSLGGNLTTINGSFTLNSTGSGSLQFATTGALTVNISGDMNISGGSLCLNPFNGLNTTLNISGNYSQTNGIFFVIAGNARTGTVNLSGNYLHTGGTLTVGGNATTNCQFVFNKSGTQTFTASSNTVSGNMDFTVNSGSTLDLGTSVLTGRNFTLSSGAGIIIGSVNGITTSGATGNIQTTTSRTFSAGAAYILSGGVGQVSGNAFPTSITNMTVNNYSGITLSANATVAGTLTFINGKVNTGSNELIVSNTSSNAITGYSSSNYVIGNLRRSVTASGAYDFPLGTASNYELVSVNLSGITGFTDIVGTFTNTNPIESGYPLSSLYVGITPITEMLDYGYWTLTPNSSMTGGSYSVTINEKGHTNSAADPSQYCVLKRSGLGSPWQSLGTHDNNTQSEARGVAVASKTGLTGFSHFGIGKGAGALPIELVYFDAKPSGNCVKCSWQTASEVNNNFFTVERSSNGRDFTPIATVAGAGNSTSTKNYSTMDNNVSSGQLYYRLKQTDFDGQFTYSKIKSVILGVENRDAIISISSVSPNPFQESFSVTYSVQQDADITVALMNSVGQLVYSEKKNSIKGINQFDYNEGSNLPNGVYFVRISFDDKVQIKKIIKN
ncbi:MAG: T9SS type A sorting domain-containing protein [Bacteroidia bacterium]|nr:T9SS type A sorting domain-containing protein [Bacteroidia bacterium]